VIFLAGLTILKKERCMGRLSGCKADPAVALHLRNAADYRLPSFWATWHLTRAFLKSVNNKSDLSGWFDNSKKGEVSWQIEWMGG
jgi:hypothetical protein